MRIQRPYIPLAVRLQVAERQLRELGLWDEIVKGRTGWPTKSGFLHLCLSYLRLPLGRLELHHRPALVNRSQDDNGQYVPAANDPAYLVYLPKGEHDVETRVHGVGAQRSDLGQRRYNKKVARNRAPKPKRPWRWPKGRKLRSRAINPGWRRKQSRKARGWPQSRPLGR